MFKPLSGSEESKRLEYGSLKYNVGKNNFDSMNDTFSSICYFSNFINKVKIFITPAMIKEGSRFWSSIKMVKESCDVHSE